MEWSGHSHIGRSVRVDADVAWSRARFTDFDPVGDRIPGAVEGVVSTGVTVSNVRRFSGALRLRYFGPRPLIEDNTARSRSSTTLSGDVGYSLGRWGLIAVEGFNLLDAKASDIDYFYTSRLRGEPATGVDDIHTHPVAPRTLRLRLSATWPRAEDAGNLPVPSGHPQNEGARSQRPR